MVEINIFIHSFIHLFTLNVDKFVLVRCINVLKVCDQGKQAAAALTNQYVCALRTGVLSPVPLMTIRQ